VEKTPIQFGKYSIPTPCRVGEEELRRIDGRKQFCNSCQKVVHDISGLEPRQIEALRRAQGGKLCVAFYETKPPLETDSPRPIAYRLMPLWLQGAAATAALAGLLLYAPATRGAMLGPTTWSTLSSPGGHLDSASIHPDMMLSSVVLNQNDENIGDDILIIVELPNGKKREITSSAGFFALNLEGIAMADEMIGIHIKSQKFEDYRGSRTYPDYRAQIKASAAQNATISLKVEYVHNRLNRGDMIR
jgi:hypothetical protein